MPDVPYINTTNPFVPFNANYTDPTDPDYQLGLSDAKAGRPVPDNRRGDPLYMKGYEVGTGQLQTTNPPSSQPTIAQSLASPNSNNVSPNATEGSGSPAVSSPGLSGSSLSGVSNLLNSFSGAAGNDFSNAASSMMQAIEQAANAPLQELMGEFNSNSGGNASGTSATPIIDPVMTLPKVTDSVFSPWQGDGLQNLPPSNAPANNVPDPGGTGAVRLDPGETHEWSSTDGNGNTVMAR